FDPIRTNSPRYYMSLLFQISFACAYASVLHADYVWTNMGGLNLYTFFAHCIPMPFFLLGGIDLWTLACNLVSMLCIIGLLFGTGLLVYHFAILCGNQTTHERANSITKYRLKRWSLN